MEGLAFLLILTFWIGIIAMVCSIDVLFKALNRIADILEKDKK